MFAVQTKKNKLANVDDLFLISTAFFLLANLSNKDKNKKKTAFKLYTQAAYKISELLCLKIAKIKKYEIEFFYKSNFFLHHQIV